jgi:hypothetical protein
VAVAGDEAFFETGARGVVDHGCDSQVAKMIASTLFGRLRE